MNFQTRYQAHYKSTMPVGANLGAWILSYILTATKQETYTAAADREQKRTVIDFSAPFYKKLLPIFFNSFISFSIFNSIYTKYQYNKSQEAELKIILPGSEDEITVEATPQQYIDPILSLSDIAFGAQFAVRTVGLAVGSKEIHAHDTPLFFIGAFLRLINCFKDNYKEYDFKNKENGKFISLIDIELSELLEVTYLHPELIGHI